MVQALLKDVANNTLGRGVASTVSAGLDAFDAFFNAARSRNTLKSRNRAPGLAAPAQT
jgi:hypothetical protein